MTVIGTTTAIAMTDEFLPFPVFTKKKKEKKKKKTYDYDKRVRLHMNACSSMQVLNLSQEKLC